ncbi:TPA: pyrimidine-nucleoside phosphorylase, partial [Streptococcus suis]
AVKTDNLDYETGTVFHKKVGEAVSKGEQIATIYANENISENMLTNFQKNVKINKESVKTKEIIEIIS